VETKLLNFSLSASILFMNLSILGLDDTTFHYIFTAVFFMPYFIYSRKADFSSIHKNILTVYLVLLAMSILGNWFQHIGLI
jgi:hypothetical protein